MLLNENNLLQKIISTIKPNDIYQIEKIYSSQLSTESWRNYCPLCKERIMRGEGENWRQSLKPLWKHTYKLLVSNDGKNGRYIYENQYHCMACERKYKESELIHFFVNPCRETEFVDITKLKEQKNEEDYKW